MKTLFALTPYESRRLLAKATAMHPDLQRAIEDSYVLVAGGTTNAYVLEELLEKPVEKARYTAGICMSGTYCVTPKDYRTPPVVLFKGQPSELSWDDALAKRRPGTVVIKGANAVDTHGRVGVFLGSKFGGTIAATLGTVRAMGFKLIVPVGLEKLVPDVEQASFAMGMSTTDVSFGLNIGMMPILGAEVITEIEALDLLTEVDACAVGAGGIDGSEGQVVLACWGDETNVQRTVDLIHSIKGEEPLEGVMLDCEGCQLDCELRYE